MTTPKIHFEWKFSVGNIITLVLIGVSLLSFAIRSSADIDQVKETNGKQEVYIERNRREIEDMQRRNEMILEKLRNIETQQAEMAKDVKELIKKN